MGKTIELKPCPLCGAPGKGKRTEVSFPHGWVGCPDCGLYINWVHDPKDAVRKWNRRAEANPAERIAEERTSTGMSETRRLRSGRDDMEVVRTT